MDLTRARTEVSLYCLLLRILVEFLYLIAIWWL